MERHKTAKMKIFRNSQEYIFLDNTWNVGIRKQLNVTPSLDKIDLY